MDNLVHPLRSAARIAAEKDRSFTVHLHLQIVESSIFNFSGTFTALSGRTGFEVLQFFNINFYRLRLPGTRVRLALLYPGTVALLTDRSSTLSNFHSS